MWIEDLKVGNTYYLAMNDGVHVATVTKQISRLIYEIDHKRIDHTNNEYNMLSSTLTINENLTTHGRVEWTTNDGLTLNYPATIRMDKESAYRFLIRQLGWCLDEAEKSRKYFRKLDNLEKLSDKI